MIDFRGIHSGFLIAIFAWILATPAGGAVYGIYWADAGWPELFPEGSDDYARTHFIGRYDLGTGNAGTIRSTGDFTQPAWVLLDSQAGHLYWLENSLGGLYRSNRDGGQMIQLLGAAPASLFKPATGGAAFDAAHGHIYWPDLYSGPAGVGYLWRYDINHPQTPELFMQGLAIHDLAIDSAGEYAYFVTENYFSESEQAIGRIRLATGETSTVISFGDSDSTGILGAIELDELNGRIYWSMLSAEDETSAMNGFWRSNLDGSDAQRLNSHFPNSIKADPVGGHLYWTDLVGLYRSDMDGDNIETLLMVGNLDGKLSYPQSIALDPNPIPLPGAAWAGLGLLGVLAARRGRLERAG